jgi:cell division protein FtsA
MAKGRTIVGIDVGTTAVRAVVAAMEGEEEKPQIVGVGVAPSSGLQKGVVTDIEETVQAISAAAEAAERMSGIPIEHAVFSIGGAHISAQVSKGVIAVSRADGEISEEDVTRVINAAQAISLPSNREILHVIPRDFIVDGQSGITDPVGMTGVRLEVEAVIIESSSPFIKNLTKCAYQAGVGVDDVVLAPLAAALSSLNKRQRELGVVLIDLGGGTTSICVYEEQHLLTASVLPVGAAHITNDIAIGLRTSVDIAEKVKRQYGTANPSEIKKNEMIDLKELGDEEGEKVARREVAEIIEARLEEIFTLVDKELRGIDRSGMLPAGAVIVGGGAKLPGVIDVVKRVLRLPAQIGYPQELVGLVERIDDPAYAVAVGLLLWQLEEEKFASRPHRALPGLAVSAAVRKIRDLFRAFLP